MFYNNIRKVYVCYFYSIPVHSIGKSWLFDYYAVSKIVEWWNLPIRGLAVTSFRVMNAVTLISLLSDIASQLTRFNDPSSAPLLLSVSLSLFLVASRSPLFFHNQSAALVPKCRKKGEAPLGHSVHNVEWQSGIIRGYRRIVRERVRTGGGGGFREWGEWMDREADVDHMPPSMLNTLSPGQSSPRLEASPLLFAIPPFTSSPMPSFLPHRISRPLTFYHHNRYIIPRSVFYSRVTHRGMRLFGILYASPSSPILFFSPSSFFPPVI